MSKIILAAVILGAGGLLSVGAKPARAFDHLTTHPALTEQMVELYNLTFPNDRLTNAQKELIVEGSTDEDTPPRWINHFYDPLYNEGWKGELAGIWPSAIVQFLSLKILSTTPSVTSKQWSQDPARQAKYSLVKGDRTWQKALADLAADPGSSEAYYTIGFVLHLIEDAAVPDHTRGDTHAHPLEFATGDYGSPYEEYANRYTRNEIKDLAKQLFRAGERPVQFSALNPYFDAVAGYSNNFFFSKDTIYSPKYFLPAVVKDDGVFGYGRDRDRSLFPLAGVTMARNAAGETIKKYILTQDPLYYPVLQAYFARHSRAAVIHGAGIIKLWRDQARALAAAGQPARETAQFVPPVVTPMTVFSASQAALSKNILSLLSAPELIPLVAFNAPTGRLSSPVNLLGSLKVPLSTLEDVLKKFPASLAFGSADNSYTSTPALFINPSDPALALLQPYLVSSSAFTAPGQPAPTAAQKTAALVMDLQEKTSRLATEAEYITQKAAAALQTLVASSAKPAVFAGLAAAARTGPAYLGSVREMLGQLQNGTVYVFGKDPEPQTVWDTATYRRTQDKFLPVFDYDQRYGAVQILPFSRRDALQVEAGFSTYMPPLFLGDKIEVYNPVLRQSVMAARNDIPPGFVPLTAALQAAVDAETPRLLAGGEVISASAAAAYYGSVRPGAKLNTVIATPAPAAVGASIAPPPATAPLGIIDRALALVDSAYAALRQAVNSIVQTITPIVHKITAAIGAVARSAAVAINRAVTIIADRATDYFETVKGAPGRIAAQIQQSVAAAAPAVKSVYQSVSGAVVTAFNWLGW